MFEEIIVDADFCIKLGKIEKYPLLQEVLILLAKKIYIHSYVLNEEILIPENARKQLDNLHVDKKIIIVNKTGLNPLEKLTYNMSYKKLESVMMNPRDSKKNKGEVCSLAYAKAKGIEIFVTDEKELQPIIDSRLNVGLNDIRCIRIIDIVNLAKNNEISLSRKIAKLIWIISGKDKQVFDDEIWPL